MLSGTGVSAGVARGTAFVVACGDRSAIAQRSIAPSEVDAERERFDRALARAAEELKALQDDVGERLGRTQGDIFGAQALVVADPALRDQVLAIVREQRVNVEAALAQVIDTYTRALDAIPDTYLRERGADVRDVGRRVLSALIGRQGPEGLGIPAGAIVVAEELLPSVTARMELGHARAFVMERGNRFSHTSILARSMGTPAVVGVPEASLRIRTGQRVIVDGTAGTVFVDPDPSVEREYERVEAVLRAESAELHRLARLPSVTEDGTAVPLLANLNKLAEADVALRHGAEGVGLFRTEFGFSIAAALPSEDEQYDLLFRAASRFNPRPVVFRMLDLGGDKILPYFPLPPSRNPSLAERGIRLLLRHLDVLKPQLRAFLRVSADHPVSILIPVVGGVDEVREVRALVRQVQGELSADGRRFRPDVPLGAMIEVPSAALTARALAREVDFLSLGTNDLVQYVLAADREDERVASYYQPLHPAVLRLIGAVVEAADAAGRELTICGEMAGDPLHTELLLGLGLRSLSVAPGEMLAVRSAIRRTRLAAAKALAERAVELGSSAEVEALLRARGAESAGSP
jgi:phosphotransferase system enzyme I (PtsI)